MSKIIVNLYAFFWVITWHLNLIWQVGACRILHAPTCLWRWNRQNVLKHGHIKFRRQGITQKKACNIQNTAKVWNKKNYCCLRWTWCQLCFRIEGISVHYHSDAPNKNQGHASAQYNSHETDCTSYWATQAASFHHCAGTTRSPCTEG